MSDFEKYIEAKYPNRSPKILFQKFKDIDGTLFYGIKEIEDQAEVWNHQQAIIDEHTEVIKLQDADLRKYEKQIESLKAQLNSMETCYVEKKKECEGLQEQLKTWKGQSLAAMLHGTCECGEPWQSIVSDREGFNLLHCFSCKNDRYENKEFFGNHEPKTLRGES